VRKRAKEFLDVCGEGVNNENGGGTEEQVLFDRTDSSYIVPYDENASFVAGGASAFRAAVIFL
jgi:hypothetical protein